MRSLSLTPVSARTQLPDLSVIVTMFASAPRNKIASLYSPETGSEYVGYLPVLRYEQRATVGTRPYTMREYGSGSLFILCSERNASHAARRLRVEIPCMCLSVSSIEPDSFWPNW